MITELEFKSLAAQGYNRIPLIAEAFADLETPLSLYLKLAGGQRHSFLLESVVGGERFGRYSFIGLPARTLLRASGWRTEVRAPTARSSRRTRAIRSTSSPPTSSASRSRCGPGCRASAAGWPATSATTRCATSSRKLAQTEKPGGLDTPDILLLQSEELAVIDNLSGRLYLIVYADPGRAEAYFRAKRRLAELSDKLRYSVSAPAVKRGAVATPSSASSPRPTTWPRWRSARNTSPPAT